MVKTGAVEDGCCPLAGSTGLGELPPAATCGEFICGAASLGLSVGRAGPFIGGADRGVPGAGGRGVPASAAPVVFAGAGAPVVGRAVAVSVWPETPDAAGVRGDVP